MSISTPKEVYETCLKRGRHISSQNVSPHKRRPQMSIGTLEEVHDKKILKKKEKKGLAKAN